MIYPFFQGQSDTTYAPIIKKAQFLHKEIMETMPLHETELMQMLGDRFENAIAESDILYLYVYECIESDQEVSLKEMRRWLELLHLIATTMVKFRQDHPEHFPKPWYDQYNLPRLQELREALK